MPPTNSDPEPAPLERLSRARPLRDSPWLILVGIVLFLAALVGLLGLADRSAALAPDYLAEVVLYALSAACMTMLVALGFMLARNILKIWVERRRAAPFARFRAKLVAALLAMTLIPSLLVLLVGSELIRNSAQRWFSAPIDEVLTSSNEIARDYYTSRQRVVSDHARRIADQLSGLSLDPGNVARVRAFVTPDVSAGLLGRVDIFRVMPLVEGAGPRGVEALLEVVMPTGPQGYSRAAAERLAERVAAGADDAWQAEPLAGGAEVVRAGVAIRNAAGDTVGVVVASDALTGSVTFHARRISDAYEGYNQLRVLQRPLAGFYLTVFILLTLMILISATWLGTYVAKRITRPVQMLAAGAREIQAGHFDHRVERQNDDEFGSLIEAFNTMAGELATKQSRLERSQHDLERKNQELDQRRQYMETILERIATGVVSTDARGRITTLNPAASRLLALQPAAIGEAAPVVFARPDLEPLAAAFERARVPNGSRPAQEVALNRDGREVNLAVAATTLPAPGGTVMVLDDVTPLIRAQRVATWRDVARRLAHEIKNPLTPIRLCAERLRQHFSGSPARTRELVGECTTTIVGEVEALKSLVDEFSQFARMPAPRFVTADLNAVVNEVLLLYDGLLTDIAIEPRLDPVLPAAAFDPQQVRSVVVNLIDNAVDVLQTTPAGRGETGLIEVLTEHDIAAGAVRLMVRDNGPGVPAEDRDKLFMPYFSTKRRGSGLGLAIVRRIVAEHGGRIEVAGHEPRGTVFTVEIPCGTDGPRRQ